MAVTVNAAFVWFNSFLQDLGRGVIDLDGHTIKAYASNDTPVVATDAVKGDVTEISTGNGYSGPVDVAGSFSQTAGLATFSIGTAFVITATGAVGPFRYIVFYDDTAASDQLIGYCAWTQSISLANTEVFTLPTGSIFTIP